MSTETNTTTGKPKTFPTWAVILLGLLLVAAAGGIAGYSGYQSELKAEETKKHEFLITEMTKQFELARQDHEAGNLEMARKRYEYIILQESNFPGAADGLARVMIDLNVLLTPVPQATPTIVIEETPDTRGEQEIFDSITAAMTASDWDLAIQNIERLRNKSVTFRAVDVDGIYYLALRNRGIKRITSGNLEEGIYDLTISSRFAPLDMEAKQYREWARQYIQASAFWGVNWQTVIGNLTGVAASLPYMVDSTGMTASDRLYQAYFEYGKQLQAQGFNCAAKEPLQTALNIRQRDDVSALMKQVSDICEVQPDTTPTEVPTPEPTPDPNAPPST